MRCNKCSGFAIYEPFFEFIGSRCMNCGKRFWDMTSHEITEFERFIIQQNNDKKIILPQRAPQQIKKCKNCKNEFLASRKLRKYCSDLCKSLVRRKEETERKCKLCLCSFMAKYNNKIYCSTDCLWKSNNNIRRLKRGY